MINLVLLFAPQDAACTETLRTGLEAQGYPVWRQPRGIQVSNTPSKIESALLGSAAVLLLWSKSAASSPDVTSFMPILLELKKTVLPLLLDQTELPRSLQHFPALPVQQPWNNIAAQLVQQTLLPPPGRDDSLIRLAALASSNLPTERKAAVKQAELMLQRNDHRPEVYAILTYLAQHDSMLGVREAAQDALHADTRKLQPSQLPSLTTNPNDMLRVRCRKCSHVTYFNKHRICKEFRQVVRKWEPAVYRDKDELLLRCEWESCGAEITVQVNCEGYRSPYPMAKARGL